MSVFLAVEIYLDPTSMPKDCDSFGRGKHMRKIIGAVLAGIIVIAGGWFAVTTLAPELIETTPEPALALEQNYSATLANATVNVDYPATWALGAEFPDLGVNIATTEALAETVDFDGNVAEDEVFIEILFASESALDGDTPAAILQGLVDDVENPEGTVSDIETRTINGRVLAFVTLDSNDGADGMTVVVDSGDAYSLITAAVSDGDLAQYQATIEAIAGSIEYISTIEEAEMTPEVTSEPEATEASE